MLYTALCAGQASSVCGGTDMHHEMIVQCRD